jgi:DNA-binding transcriptional regulator YiaG
MKHPIQCDYRTKIAGLGISQSKLARLIGAHPNSVSRWMRGKAKPDSVSRKMIGLLAARPELIGVLEQLE